MARKKQDANAASTATTETKPKPTPRTRAKKTKDTGELKSFNSLLARPRQTLGDTVQVQNPQAWTNVLAALDRLTTEGRGADREQAARDREIRKWLIGLAVLRFVGPGAVQGVVQTDQDPNRRTNPRPLSEDHLIKLAGVLATQGVKDDRRTPIRVKAPPEGLEPSLEEAMKQVDPFDPDCQIPTLKLKREHAEEEDRLEREIYALSDGVNLLSDNEVAERKVRLDQLRAARTLATLINGNHRMNAMQAVCQPLADAALHIAMSSRNNVEGFDVVAEWESLTGLLKNATYLVEVYDYNTPAHVLAWLAENEQERPQYAPLAGETMWSLVECQETIAKLMVEDGEATDRKDALGKLNALRERRQKEKQLSQGENDILNRLSSLPMNRRGSSLGDKECLALMAQPTTMEMVRDTSVLLCLYNAGINNTHAKGMLTGDGACLVAHTWLGARLLLKLTNTTLGVGLTDAENFIAAVTINSLTAKGLEESRTHFKNLTSAPQDFPALLPLWEHGGYASFEAAAATHIYGAGFSLCKADYHDVDFCVALRRTYFDFGKRLVAGRENEERARRLAAAVLIYALLPLWEPGFASEEPYFYPAAILPNKATYSRYTESMVAPMSSLGIWVTEFLLDRTQLIWTAGSGSSSTSRQANNWWGRIDGQHQILMRCYENARLGPVDARLSTAIDLLEDPRFQAAIVSINESEDAIGVSATDLRSTCSAMKTAKPAFPVLSTIYPCLGGSRGTFAEVQKAITEARKGVKAFITSDQTVDALYAAHPVLAIIPKVYFADPRVREWVRGWDDSEQKIWGTATSLMGWFFVSEELRLTVFPAIFPQIPSSRFLLHVSRKLDTLEGKTPWWVGLAGVVEDEVANGTRVPRPRLVQPNPSSKKTGSKRAKRAATTAAPDPNHATHSTTPLNPRSTSVTAAPTTAPSTNKVVVELPLRQPKSPASNAKKSARVVSDIPPPPPPESETDDEEPSRRRRSSKRSTPKSREYIKDEDDEDDEIPPVDELLTNKRASVPAKAKHAVAALPGPTMKTGHGSNESSNEGDFGRESVRNGGSRVDKDEEEHEGMLPTIDSAQFADSINPGHILMRDASLLDHGHDYSFACQKHITCPEEAAEEDMERNTDEYDELVEAVLEERQRLRQSVAVMSAMATRNTSYFPYVAEYAVSSLANNVLMCKDAFVARLADILAAHLGEPSQKIAGEGMLDALAMVAADGLYDNEMFRIGSRNELTIHLENTFPIGQQPLLPKGHTRVSTAAPVGGNDPVDLSTAWDRMSRFSGARGYGRTAAESSARGIDGVFAVLANDDLSRKPKPQTLAPPLFETNEDHDVPVPGENMPTLDSIRSRIRELFSNRKSVASKLPFDVVEKRSHPIVEGYKPGLCTGVYDAYVPPGAPEYVVSHAKRFQRRARAKWSKMTEEHSTLWPPGSHFYNTVPKVDKPKNDTNRASSSGDPPGEPEPEQTAPPDDQSDGSSTADPPANLNPKTPIRPPAPRNSLVRPRGLKLQQPDSSQLGPVVPAPAKTGKQPANLSSQSLGGSQEWNASQPPFTLGQLTGNARRSETPPTPDRTQNPPGDDESADELNMEGVFDESATRTLEDEGASPDEEMTPGSEGNSEPSDEDSRYAGLGKRVRRQLAESSPEISRKASRRFNTRQRIPSD